MIPSNEELIRRFEQGYKPSELAKEYGIGESTIYRRYTPWKRANLNTVCELRMENKKLTEKELKREEAIERVGKLREQGYSYPQIAKETGIPQGTAYGYVQTWMQRQGQEQEENEQLEVDAAIEPESINETAGSTVEVESINEPEPEPVVEDMDTLMEQSAVGLYIGGLNIAEIAEQLGISNAQSWEYVNKNKEEIEKAKAEQQIREQKMREEQESASQVAAQIQSQLKNKTNWKDEVTYAHEEEVTNRGYRKYIEPIETYRRGDIVVVYKSAEEAVESRGKYVQNFGDYGRYGVVVQNDSGNKYSTNLIVTMITSKLKRTELPTHVIINSLPQVSMVMTEQLITVDKQYVTKTGHLSVDELESLDKALAASIGLAVKGTENTKVLVEREKVEVPVPVMPTFSRLKHQLQGVYNYTLGDSVLIEAGTNAFSVSKQELKDFIADLQDIDNAWNK